MSQRFQLNKKDLKSLLKGLLITLAGAALTWALTVLPKLDLGQYTPFLVPVLALLVNAGLKFITNEQGKIM